MIISPSLIVSLCFYLAHSFSLSIFIYDNNFLPTPLSLPPSLSLSLRGCCCRVGVPVNLFRHPWEVLSDLSDKTGHLNVYQYLLSLASSYVVSPTATTILCNAEFQSESQARKISTRKPVSDLGSNTSRLEMCSYHSYPLTYLASHTNYKSPINKYTSNKLILPCRLGL